MTTIVWDGKNLASDSRSCSAGTIDAGICKKIFKDKTATYAVAGDYAQSLAIIKWMTAGRDPDSEPVFLEPEYEILMVRQGTGYVFSGETHGCEHQPPVALGSGRELALGAMGNGATPKEAVEVACSMDPNSGLPVKVVKT